jgi:hypothetical protein
MPGAQEYHHGHSSLKNFIVPLLTAVIELLIHRGALNFVVTGADKQDSNKIGLTKNPRYFRQDLVEAGFLLISPGLEEVGGAQRQANFGLGRPRQKSVSNGGVTVSPKCYGIAIVELAVQARIEEFLNGFGNALGPALHGAGGLDDQQATVGAGRNGLGGEREGEQEQQRDDDAQRGRREHGDGESPER